MTILEAIRALVAPQAQERVEYVEPTYCTCFMSQLRMKVLVPSPDLPWFIGEYGANGQTEAVIVSDLQSMDQKALTDKPLEVL